MAIFPKLIYKYNALLNKFLQTRHFCVFTLTLFVCDPVAGAARRTCPGVATALAGVWLVPSRDGTLVYINGE